MTNNNVLRFNNRKQKGYPIYTEMPDQVNNLIDIQSLKAKYLKKNKGNIT